MFYRDQARDRDKTRSYYFCPNCRMIYVPAQDLPSLKEEKACYDEHQNDPLDQGYRKFLSRMFEAMLKRIKKGEQGLDFGSGPGPTLSLMFEEAGFAMKIYDPLYADNPAVLEKRYSFITATEVVEHLHQPKAVLDKLWAILKEGGTLGIMTKISTGMEVFPAWHYKNDATHVCFFARESFKWLANEWQAQLEFVGSDVILIRKV